MKASIRGRFGRHLLGGILFQGIGKLIQIVGVAYAARCLGPDNLGMSGTVIVVAANLQLLLDFGLDIVAVRHASARTVRLNDIISALFTLRVLIAGAAAVVWLAAALLAPISPTASWVWCWGSPYMVLVILNFNWYYQATERMAHFSFLQMAVAVGISIYYLLFFHPNQAAGSDLLVHIGFNAVAVTGVWLTIKRVHRIRLWRFSQLTLARELFHEARPNWLFNLCYCLLSTMSLPMIYILLGNRESGLFRSAMMLVDSVKLFLAYFGYMMYPRIVAWRNFESTRFRPRIILVIGGMVLMGMLAFGVLEVIHRPLYLFIFGDEYRAASGLLPILVLARFLATASGIVIWALFANRQDWLGVQLCLGPLVVAFFLHWLLLPKYGVVAAAWLNLFGELGLFSLCLAAFFRMRINPNTVNPS